MLGGVWGGLGVVGTDATIFCCCCGSCCCCDVVTGTFGESSSLPSAAMGTRGPSAVIAMAMLRPGRREPTGRWDALGVGGATGTGTDAGTESVTSSLTILAGPTAVFAAEAETMTLAPMVLWVPSTCRLTSENPEVGAEGTIGVDAWQIADTIDFDCTWATCTWRRRQTR